MSRHITVLALFFSVAYHANTQAAEQTAAPPPGAGAVSTDAETRSPPPGYGPPPPGHAPPPGYYGPPPGYYAPPPGYYGPPPGYYAPPPRLAPTKDLTVRRHDGFYLRMGLGLGYGYVRSSGTLSPPASSGFEQQDVTLTYKGLGPAYELLIGGTIARGLVLGGGFVGQDILDPRLSLSDGSSSGLPKEATIEGGLGVGALGPFVDWFPNEYGGLHFGLMAGFAFLGLPNKSGHTNLGFAGSLWGGYDFWVAAQWSLGVEARVAGVTSHREIGLTLHDKAVTLELLFTALYH